MSKTYEVPLNYTINVSLTATPSGLADFNTNSIAIFTNEQAGFSDSYQAYITPSAVSEDFGTDSLTYKMANALFTPVPNFRTGGGYLYIFPFGGTNATPGAVTTASIAAKLTAFKSVQDGSLQIAIDGTTYVIEDLDFSNISTVADIVDVLNSQNLDVYIEAVGNTIKFTSKRFGEDATVSITTQTESSGTDIATSSYLDIANATSTTGADSSGQTLAEAVTAALEQVYFGKVITTQYVDDTTFVANSTAIQSKDVVYFEAINSMKDIAGVGSDIKTAGNGKTRTLAYSVGAEESKLAIATYSTIASGVNYNGADTAITMNLKTLTGVKGDPGLSNTYLLSAQTNGVDVYGITGGLSCVYSNDNNGYTDEVCSDLWLKKALEVAGFNYLRQTNTKIPQTEEGMTGLKNAYLQICEKAVRNGNIAPGTWNGSIPFGNPEDFARNIEEKGYYIYSIPVAIQSQTEREERKAPVVQIALKRSGAFHFSDVIVNIQR